MIQRERKKVGLKWVVDRVDDPIERYGQIQEAEGSEAANAYLKAYVALRRKERGEKLWAAIRG
jgi:hypothetical protein